MQIVCHNRYTCTVVILNCNQLVPTEPLHGLVSQRAKCMQLNGDMHEVSLLDMIRYTGVNTRRLSYFQ